MLQSDSLDNISKFPWTSVNRVFLLNSALPHHSQVLIGLVSLSFSCFMLGFWNIHCGSRNTFPAAAPGQRKKISALRWSTWLLFGRNVPLYFSLLDIKQEPWKHHDLPTFGVSCVFLAFIDAGAVRSNKGNLQCFLCAHYMLSSFCLSFDPRIARCKSWGRPVLIAAPALNAFPAC